MTFVDKLNFDSSTPDDKKAMRSASGEKQTKIAEIFLPGKPFDVNSAGVEVMQSSGDKNVDWFNDKSSAGSYNTYMKNINNEQKTP